MTKEELSVKCKVKPKQVDCYVQNLQNKEWNDGCNDCVMVLGCRKMYEVERGVVDCDSIGSKPHPSFVNERETFTCMVNGSHTFGYYPEFKKVMDYILKTQYEKNNDVVIITGDSDGTCRLAKRYADEVGLVLHEFRSDKEQYGNKAEFVRDGKMHKFLSDCVGKKGCICFWNMQQDNVIQNFTLAKAHGLPLRVYSNKLHKFLTKEEINLAQRESER